MLRLIESAIKIKSTESNPEEILKIMDLFKEEFGKDFKVKEYKFKGRPMLVLSNTDSKEVDFILAGHSDVVPGSTDLFSIRKKGDKLIGRGTYDMKAPLIVAIFALSCFLKESHDLKVAVFITTDEEKDGLSTKYLLEEQGYRAKFAILPDGGSQRELVVSQKGFLQLELNIKGKSAHASTPFKSQNPIIDIYTIYHNLLKEYPLPKSGDDWKTSICLSKVNADSGSINKIPGTASACLDIRYVNPSHVKEIINFIKKMDIDVTVRTIAENGPLNIDENNIYVSILRKAMQKNFGAPVVLSRTCGTSDAVFFSDFGVPAVLFRPEGGGAHQDFEWVSKKSLESLWKVFYDFLKKFK